MKPGLVVALAVVAAWGIACESPPAGAPQTPPEPTAPRPPSRLERSLLELADSARKRGELDVARGRYQRVLDDNPRSSSAWVGLARVDLAAGDLDGARRSGRRSLSIDADAPEPRVVLAEIERRAGNTAEAQRLLRAALDLDPSDHRAHAALEELTGPVPEDATGDALRLAWQHPYDPSARLQAARVLLERGADQSAKAMLLEAVWLSDLDPGAGADAWSLLSEVDPRFGARRRVLVHCYADETVRNDSSWRTRLRFEWRGLSRSLDPALETLFVPVSMNAVDGRAATGQLSSLEQSLRRDAGRLPARGLVAFLTERPPPRRRTSTRLGEAMFLGRRLIARLEPGQVGSRTLIHEVLHIYGGIHIAEGLPSILNPAGNSLAMDPQNLRITQLVRDRRFGPGGVDLNVLPFVDVEALAGAYTQALRVDLTFRQLGVVEALEERRSSRFSAARMVVQAQSLDPHLADVAGFTATLYLRQERLSEAVYLLDVATQLYGPNTQRGRESRQWADAILARGLGRSH